MFRSVLKSVFARAISWTGLSPRVPFVVFYHRVVERLGGSTLALPAMEISVAMLERHLDWIGRHFDIVSPEDLDRPARSKPLAAITFDDGYSDVFHHAFPLLQRKGIPAGIFVITDLVGTKQLPMHERLHALLADSPDAFAKTRSLLARLPQAEVKRMIDGFDGPLDEQLQPMSWEMLAEMRDAGMTIGSHSKSHPFLTNESNAVAIEETAGSRRELQQRLGIDASCFAYPGGCFDASVVESVAAAGYRYAYTTCAHRDGRHPQLTIPRVGLWERSSLDPFGGFSASVMNCHAAGAFRWMSRCGLEHTPCAA